MRGGLLYLLVALVVGASVGLTAGWSWNVAVVMTACLIVGMLVLLRPWSAYLIVAFAVCGVSTTYALPVMEVGGSGIFASEVVLLACFVATALAALRRPGSLSEALTPPGLALVWFLVASLAGLGVAWLGGTRFAASVSDARGMVFYLAFWIALFGMRKVGSTKAILLGMAGIGVIGSVSQIAQVLVGSGHRLYLTDAASAVLTTMSDTGFLRVRPPGLTTMYVGLVFATAYLVWGPRAHRLMVAGVLGLFAAGVVLSLNRNMLIGFAFGLVVAQVLCASTMSRAVRSLATLSLIALVIVVVVAAAPGSIGRGAVADRIASLGNLTGLETTTLDERWQEDRLATAAIGHAPIQGIGWGTPYGATTGTVLGQLYTTVPKTFIHNEYLGAWLHGGLLGLVALLWMLLSAGRSGVRWARQSEQKNDLWLGYAVVASLSAIAASSSVGLYLTTADSIVPLCGVLAIAAVLFRRLRHEKSFAPRGRASDDLAA